MINGEYDQKCDVWSCGVILYVMLSGKPPFNGRNDKTIFKRIVSGKLRFPSKEWKNISSEAKELIKKMLTRNPKERPSAEEIFNDPWVQNRSRDLVSDNIITPLALNNLSAFKATRMLQQATLGFIASHLISAQETEELRKAFISIDTDGDGKLSREELEKGYSKAKIKIDIDHILKTCDADGNGFIDYSEFITATLNWEKSLSAKRLEEAFKAYDTDASGTITMDELQSFFGAHKDDKVYQEIMKEADTNGDGVIDLEEFKSLMLSKF